MPTSHNDASRLNLKMTPVPALLCIMPARLLAAPTPTPPGPHPVPKRVSDDNKRRYHHRH